MQTITNSENASPEQQDRFVIVHTHAMQNKGKRRGTWTAKEKIHNTNPKKKIKRIRDTILYGFA